MLGGLGAYFIQKQTWRTQELQNLRLEVASTYLLIWDEENGYVQLRAHFQYLKVRLDMLGFNPKILDPFRESALACWHNRRNSIDEGDVLGGINSALLDKFESNQNRLEKILKK